MTYEEDGMKVIPVARVAHEKDYNFGLAWQ